MGEKYDLNETVSSSDCYIECAEVELLCSLSTFAKEGQCVKILTVLKFKTIEIALGW